MYVNKVSTADGAQWFKSGYRVFFQQPLVFLLIGLTVLPWYATKDVSSLGMLLTCGLWPLAALAILVTCETVAGGNVRPGRVLLAIGAAFKKHAPAMLVLGGLYAASQLLIEVLMVILDGGDLARIYLRPVESIDSMDLVTLLHHLQLELLGLTIALPIHMMLWLAPALVYWYGTPLLPGLGYSLKACWRNIGAYTVYNLVLLLCLALVFVPLVIAKALSTDPWWYEGLKLLIQFAFVAVAYPSLNFTCKASFTDAPG